MKQSIHHAFKSCASLHSSLEDFNKIKVEKTNSKYNDGYKKFAQKAKTTRISKKNQNEYPMQQKRNLKRTYSNLVLHTWEMPEEYIREDFCRLRSSKTSLETDWNSVSMDETSLESEEQSLGVIANELLSFHFPPKDTKQKFQAKNFVDTINLLNLDENGLVKSGSKKKLFDVLLDDEYLEKDPNYSIAFILGHHQFMDTLELWEMIQHRYRLGVNVDRIISILCSWVELSLWDFKQGTALYKLLIAFLDDLDIEEHRKMVLEILDKKQSGGVKRSSILKRVLSGNVSIKFRLKDEKKWKILDFSAELAQQLAHQEHCLFSSIPMKEFIHAKWTEKNAKESVPNIHRYIDLFNRTSAWVVSEVLLASNDRRRANVIIRFITLAKKSYDLNNFNTAVAICAALNMGNISRLHESWKLVPAKDRNMFKKLTQLVSPSNNFKLFRDVMKVKAPPMNPYLGLNLRDLALIEWHNDTFVVEEVVNFHKVRLIFPILNSIQQMQSIAYNYESNIYLENYLQRVLDMDNAKLASIMKMGDIKTIHS